MSTQDTTVEKTDAEATEVEETETAAEPTEAAEDLKTEDEADAQEVDTSKRDYDAEIAEEKKRGKPDPLRAVEAFKDRKQKREVEVVEEESVDDMPLTRKDIAEVEIRVERRLLGQQALTIAKGMAASDKEAELIVEKWKNRSFPEGLSLSDQIEEAYAITHSKKLIGERNEALRALRSKEGVNRNPAASHRQSPEGKEPKIAPQDAEAIKAAGFLWNGTSRNWEKKLPNGDTLVRDSKTKATRIVKKAK